METLATLKPSFEALGAYRPYNGESFDEMALRVYPQARTIQHVHHAGNSSGIVDGAGAVLIASPEYARAHGLQPRARAQPGHCGSRARDHAHRPHPGQPQGAAQGWHGRAGY